MPTTTNFGWTTPADTDLVKNGALAMRTLGNGIDTSLAYLKGGTTGQILSKTNGTDLAFTWITPNPGDITSVGVTSPITGGGTSGDVTIAIQDASTTQKGAVQLTDSTSSISTTTAATPNSVKSAYDLANGAIAKTLTSATGDLIYASSANTPARLAIGSTGNILTVSGGVPVWSAPAGGSGMTLITTVDASSSNSAFATDNVFTSTYDNYLIIGTIDSFSASGTVKFQLRGGGSNVQSNYNSGRLYADGSGVGFNSNPQGTDEVEILENSSGSFSEHGAFFLYVFKPYLSTKTRFEFSASALDSSNNPRIDINMGFNTNATSYDGFRLVSNSNFTGKWRVFGLANS